MQSCGPLLPFPHFLIRKQASRNLGLREDELWTFFDIENYFSSDFGHNATDFMASLFINVVYCFDRIPIRCKATSNKNSSTFGCFFLITRPVPRVQY